VAHRLKQLEAKLLVGGQSLLDRDDPAHILRIEDETPLIEADPERRCVVLEHLEGETFTEGANPWSQVEMSFERGMHAEQEYVFHGPPPRAGDRLFATSRIDKIWSKESRSAGTLTFVKMITEFRDDAGELRAEAILTGVETGHAPVGEGA
jgi:hypothetical protein